MNDLFVLPPQAVQRTRAKGARLPEGCVPVDRSTRWGNPFRAGETPHLVILWRWGWNPPRSMMGICPDTATAVRWFGECLRDDAASVATVRANLRGRPLACFCALPARGKPDVCHRAHLMAVANAEEARDA